MTKSSQIAHRQKLRLLGGETLLVFTYRGCPISCRHGMQYSTIATCYNSEVYESEVALLWMGSILCHFLCGVIVSFIVYGCYHDKCPLLTSSPLCFQVTGCNAF